MPKRDVDDLTIGQVKELAAYAAGGQSESQGPQLTPGKAYFFFGIPLYRLGRLVRMHGKWAVVGECGWVADTGRTSDAFTSGQLNEFEPIPGEVWINTDACVDIAEWDFEIPAEAK